MRWSFLTWDGLKHMAMPVLNLALYKISLVIRLTRAGVRENLHMDYVKFARAKGLTPFRVVAVHVREQRHVARGGAARIAGHQAIAAGIGRLDVG